MIEIQITKITIVATLINNYKKQNGTSLIL